MDLEIGPGTRLGIIGPNGAGKTTLLKMCLGLLAPDAGTVVMGPTVRTAFVDQQRTDLDPDKTVLEEIGGESEVVRVGDRLVRTESFLDQFLFSGSLQRTAVSRLSGGERNRVLLAKLLCAGGNVIALDEPTNDLDLPTLRALEEALVAFEGAVVVISHDRWFLDRVATRLIHMDGHGGIVHHVGNATDLLAKLAGRERAAASATARGKPAPAPAPAAKAAPASSGASGPKTPTASVPASKSTTTNDHRPLSGGENASSPTWPPSSPPPRPSSRPSTPSWPTRASTPARRTRTSGWWPSARPPRRRSPRCTPARKRSRRGRPSSASSMGA
jgi:ABC-type multidrug transport system ATPase subunit